MSSPTAKRFQLGTHRVCDPEETRRRVTPFLERIGVTRIADVTRLDGLGIPVFQSVRPASRTLAVSQGKGATAEAAWASAAMESIELWHAEDLDHVEQVSMSLREMAFDNPVPHHQLRWQRRVVPLPAAPLRWVRCRSMNRDRDGWLPRQMMELDFRLPEAFEPSLFHKTSNGLASGNCREEAWLHGLCELIERHPVASLGGGPMPRAIDLESIAEASNREMIRRIRDRRMKLAVYDLTWEVGVPVVAAELVGEDLPVIWRGFGCHPSPGVAVSRALSEAAQSRLTYISGARDDVSYEPGAPEHCAYETFREPRPELPLADLPDLAAEDVGADLERVLQKLQDHGYEAFFVDLTHPEIGLPVVQVFVPGLADPADG